MSRLSRVEDACALLYEFRCSGLASRFSVLKIYTQATRKGKRGFKEETVVKDTGLIRLFICGISKLPKKEDRKVIHAKSTWY